ncbi:MULTISPECIES: glycosyltransferase family 4 protein [unclassified Moorena]|uniref:glycosyltransferase family 4 protein n=2 Tax=Moorena TaxID=1155738 RepID=UPI0013FFE5E6|nr:MULTISPECIES: glycosyltransferase family 4 protein [unclassified Moorena]NEO14782.1 glycosyltransferase family 4 protein [Moorena sp. SIO3E8]NEQ01180.1 glycosyltransferase family 4 protein [Moorena sp. SIO3F7]
MRLTLVTSSLSCGGAERAVALLAKGFFNKGYQVDVVTIDDTYLDFYKLPDGVNRVALNIAKNSPTFIHGILNNLYRLWVLRRTIKSLHPDVVISFLDQINILTLLALVKTNYPVLVSEQNDPRKSSSGKMWDRLRHITYSFADKVVSVGDGVNQYFDWLPETKRAVIYNPLASINSRPSMDKLLETKGADLTKKWIVAIGRLTHQKGFDILLSAFKKHAGHHPDWQLIILGEGELRPELENLRDQLGLTDNVIFPGVVRNPFSVLKRSELFVLSSRFEGLPGVLVEALACGLPVVSTDCPSGPREVIRDGVNGILVPSENRLALATALERLISNEEERKRLASYAPKITEQFGLGTIIERWEILFSDVISQQSAVSSQQSAVSSQQSAL